MEKRIDNRVYSCLLSIYTSDRDAPLAQIDRVISAFSLYQALLKNWSYRKNLVSVRDVDNLWIKHFLPSLIPLKHRLIPKVAFCLDAGSGAGFPGVPLKIMRPDIALHLCEANRMKALFLQQVVETLHLEPCEVLNTRLENLANRYDMIFSRALGKPQEVYPRLNRLLNSGGQILFWTARRAPEDFPGSICVSFDIDDGGKLLCVKQMQN